MRTSLAPVVVASLLFAWPVPPGLAAPAPTRTPASGPGALGTVRQQVRRARQELSAHPTLADYHQSPFQPSEIVERIHALEDERAWAELCRELGQLPDEDLELFEDEIRRPEHARRLACSQPLLLRIGSYWKAAEHRLATAHPIAAPAVQPSVSVKVIVDPDGIVSDGHLPEGQIALTFDDGPHPTRTPRILQILAAAGIKATFFEIGKNASAHPDVARQVVAAGHSVGSHTFSHPHMTELSERHAEMEVEAGDASVSLALGTRPGQLPFFRFPYGAKTALEQGFVEKRGNTTFFWNMDSQDWKIRDPHRLFLNVLSELDRARHGIILFHDIHEQTVIVLPHVLAELRARHMKTVVFIPAPTAPGPHAD